MPRSEAAIQRRRERQRQYYRENRERILARNEQWRSRNAEKRKQYDLAMADIKLAMKQPAGEGDKNLATLEKRVNMLIAKDKAKEKKMAAKMFG